MSSSKKVFVLFAVIFFLLLIFLSYDISRKTTFPGSKGQLKERLKNRYAEPDDSLRRDSIEIHTEL